MKINNPELKRKIQEILQEEEKHILEGIDINYKTKIVSLNLNHEQGVDTSVILNPTYVKIGQYPVISIFKRKQLKNNIGDGNPLIYALKKINNWKISEEDILILLNQFIQISGKIKNTYDTIIKIPSSNSLNTNFLYKFNEIIKVQNIIENHFFHKLTPAEIWDGYIDFENMTEKEIEQLNKEFQKMKKNTFTFKFVSTELRKYIKNIWSPDYAAEDIEIADKINDKDILVLDDTISSGSTISTFCALLLKNYAPKSVTIITLFSKV